MKIYIVIPAFEPDNKLFELCTDLRCEGINNIVIVDDGTSEKTIFKLISKAFPDIKIIQHDTNKGKGAALKTAFSYLLYRTDAEGCITADADGQHKTEDILHCMKVLSENADSLILGCRKFDWEHTPLKSRIGNRFALKTFYKITKQRVSDTQTGLRGLSRQMMEESLSFTGERFEFEMNMLVSFAGKYSIKEIPIASVYNSNNKGSHFRPVSDSIKIIRTMKKAAKATR